MFHDSLFDTAWLFTMSIIALILETTLINGEGMLGKTEDLIIVLLIILLLFGAKKIPEIARSIGQSAREVRKGFSGDDEQKPSGDTSAKKTASK